VGHKETKLESSRRDPDDMFFYYYVFQKKISPLLQPKKMILKNFN
jgi:hypothetical protein